MTLRPVPNPPAEPAAELTDEEILRWALAYLRHAPLSLSLREINRLVAFHAFELRQPKHGPVLDVGCGDGFWWTVREDDRQKNEEVYGIDISASEIAQARERIHAELTDVSRETPFRGVKFEEIIGNCSLEHVPDIDAALSNLRKAASEGARLLMFVPTPRWAYQGHTQKLLLKYAPRVAMSVSGALNGFFQHWHLYDAKVWQRLLEQNGWRVETTVGLGSARSEFLFRAFLPPAFGEFVIKKLTGFYPSRLARILPDAALAPFAKLVRWAVSDPIVPADSPHAYEYLIVAHAI
ncbi:MAG: class I SAM-dependent methyltransferase [Kofleriaceae bacterium]